MQCFVCMWVIIIFISQFCAAKAIERTIKSLPYSSLLKWILENKINKKEVRTVDLCA